MSSFISRKDGEILVAVSSSGKDIKVSDGSSITLENVMGAKVTLEANPANIVIEASVPESRGALRCEFVPTGEGYKLIRGDEGCSKDKVSSLEDLIWSLRSACNGGI